jgi:UV DNA damage endonuclease
LPDPVVPYRLGFAVKILGEGGLRTNDARRHQSEPHLSVSIEFLHGAFDYLDRIDVRVFRLSSSTVPYGTHPDLPAFDYRRQIEACAPQLHLLRERAAALGLRLSTHPGQYTVINSPDEELARKSLADLEQDAALLDALGQREGVVVVHVGGVYGDKESALARWAASYDRLSETAKRVVAVEHDDRSYTLADCLWLHERTGVRVVYDIHHDRCNPSGPTLAEAYATWGGVRPKAHVSSPRLDSTRLEAHADYVAPWDLVELLAGAPGLIDVVCEAKAKDLAVLALRAQLPRVAPRTAEREERVRPAAVRPPARRGAPPPARARSRPRG